MLVFHSHSLTSVVYCVCIQSDSGNTTKGNDNASSASKTLPAETLEFAHRMFDAARNGDKVLVEAALNAGLPSNLTNQQGS